jgi:hypothetical protein
MKLGLNQLQVLKSVVELGHPNGWYFGSVSLTKTLCESLVKRGLLVKKWADKGKWGYSVEAFEPTQQGRDYINVLLKSKE